MARIAGVDLPQSKRVEIGLSYIFGIGRTRSRRFLEMAGVKGEIKVKDLSEEEVTRIRKVVQDEGGVEGDLRKNIQQDVRRLMEIGSYRGYRHRRSLPAHGQRTHTNARTRRGKRVAIAGKKKAVSKKG